MRHRKNANPNAVGPTGNKVTRTQETRSPSLSLVTSGIGPVISDIEYDAENNILEVTRTSSRNLHSTENLKRGTAMHSVSPLALDKGSNITGPEKWFPVSGNAIDAAESPLLPDDFVHADGFGSSQPWVDKLGPNMVWVKLNPGSPPIGSASWDADEDDHSVTATPEDGKGPTLIAVTVEALDDPDAKAIVTLWFNQPLKKNGGYPNYLGPLAPLNYSHLRKIRIWSDAANIKKTAGSLEYHDTHDSALQFTVDREIGLDENVYVRIKAGLTRNMKRVVNKTSPPVPANIIADKNCYVLALYTASPYEDAPDIAAGDVVLFGNPVEVLDTQVNEDVPEEHQVPYILHHVAPAGSAAVVASESYGVVWGGNFGSESSGRTQFRFRNLNEWSLKAFAPVSLIANWSAIQLPDDWTPADELVTQTPIGVGYVRLLPFSNSIAGSEWADDGFTGKTAPIDATPTIIDVKIIGATKIYITWSQPVTIIGAAPTLVTDSVTPLTASMAATDYDNIISYVLDRAVLYSETVTLSALAGWVEAAHDSAYPSVALSNSVRNINTRNSMVLCAHRIMPVTLYRGQVVRLKDNGFQALDDAGNAQALVDIMPSTDITPQHHHSSDSDGGYSISHAWSGA